MDHSQLIRACCIEYQTQVSSLRSVAHGLATLAISCSPAATTVCAAVTAQPTFCCEQVCQHIRPSPVHTAADVGEVILGVPVALHVVQYSLRGSRG